MNRLRPSDVPRVVEGDAAANRRANHRRRAGQALGNLPMDVDVCSIMCSHITEGRMATNLALDDALIEQARRVGKHRTKKEAVTSALREYVRRRRQLEILDLVGQVPLDESYDYKPLRHRKPRS